VLKGWVGKGRGYKNLEPHGSWEHTVWCVGRKKIWSKVDQRAGKTRRNNRRVVAVGTDTPGKKGVGEKKKSLLGLNKKDEKNQEQTKRRQG